MSTYSRVILIGNLTRDPELCHSPNGTPVVDLGIAMSDRHKDAAGQWVEDTSFVAVTLFGRAAEVASEYLVKGSPLLVEGRLKLDRWEHDVTGQSRLKVIGDRMQMLTTPSKRAEPGERPTPNTSAIAVDDRDIPF